MISNYNNMQDSSLLFGSVPAPASLWMDWDASLHYQLQLLIQQYCFCSDVSSSESKVGSVQDLVIKLPNRPIKARKKNRLLHSRNIQYSLNCLEHIINNTMDNGQTIIYRSKKSRNNSKVQSSSRRSHYIGVSKNGDVWQSLIMIDRKKTYIGSYYTEEEAAKSYDFYAIVLKYLSAKTNFDYNLSEIKQMIMNYHSNGGNYLV